MRHVYSLCLSMGEACFTLHALCLHANTCQSMGRIPPRGCFTVDAQRTLGLCLCRSVSDYFSPEASHLVPLRSAAVLTPRVPCVSSLGPSMGLATFTAHVPIPSKDESKSQGKRQRGSIQGPIQGLVGGVAAAFHRFDWFVNSKKRHKNSSNFASKVKSFQDIFKKTISERSIRKFVTHFYLMSALGKVDFPETKLNKHTLSVLHKRNIAYSKQRLQVHLV